MDPATETSAARIKLAWWQEEMRRLTARVPIHPISAYLAVAAARRAGGFRAIAAEHGCRCCRSGGAPLEHGADLAPHAHALRAFPLQLASRLAAEGIDEAGLSQCTEALAEAEHYQGWWPTIGARPAPAACRSRWMSSWRRASITPIWQPINRRRASKITLDFCVNAPHIDMNSLPSLCRAPRGGNSAIYWCWRRSGSNICGNARQPANLEAHRICCSHGARRAAPIIELNSPMVPKQFIADPNLLSGRVILITGASSGLGRALAIECARAGASRHPVGPQSVQA